MESSENLVRRLCKERDQLAGELQVLDSQVSAAFGRQPGFLDKLRRNVALHADTDVDVATASESELKKAQKGARLGAQPRAAGGLDEVRAVAPHFSLLSALEKLEEKHEKTHDGMDVMADSHWLAPGLWQQRVPELEAVAFGCGLKAGWRLSELGREDPVPAVLPGAAFPAVLESEPHVDVLVSAFSFDAVPDRCSSKPSCIEAVSDEFRGRAVEQMVAVPCTDTDCSV
ncbi:unnamed protein product [Prorocentrum cordatum]|uniref:Uncharacterized protein n=1 Tax=Prorocentrum cordatum TaxID=2364126 RepID=A0ABN9X3G6_9DINO|nr:unnamed protein product [Polarella glacialis]